MSEEKNLNGNVTGKKRPLLGSPSSVQLIKVNNEDQIEHSAQKAEPKKFKFGDIEDMLLDLDKYDYEEDIIEQEDRKCSNNSNLVGINPKVGMRLEIRDRDYIWSAATIHRYHPEDNTVTVRYEGWPTTWNERLPYPDVRLAKIFTYTKEAKCFAELLTCRKQPLANLWPCKVKFRMPHPGVGTAATLLRVETFILVIPYGSRLPHSIKSSMKNGGIWIDSHKVHPFSVEHKNKNEANFLAATNTAMMDNTVIGLPSGAILEEGSLLKEEYLVTKADVLSGIQNSAFSLHSETVEQVPSQYEKSNSQDFSKANLLTQLDETEYSNLPKPIEITNPFPNEGIRYDPLMKKWVVEKFQNGIKICLGSFTSIAKAVSEYKEILCSEEPSSVEDAHAIPIPAIIAAYQDQEEDSSITMNDLMRKVFHLKELPDPPNDIIESKRKRRKSTKPNRFVR